MEEEKQSTTWKYVGNVKPLKDVIHSPRLDAPQEEKDAFIRVLDKHISVYEKEIAEEKK